MIIVTKRWFGNGSDAVIITPKYRSNHKISLDTAQNAFFYTFTTHEISIQMLWKPLHRGQCDAMRPCFYAMLPELVNQIQMNLYITQ